jgi:signal transduction histidine kinase
MVAAFFSLASDFRLLLLQLVVVSLTACAAFVNYGGPLGVLFTGLLPMFTAVLVNYGRTFAQNTHDNLRMRFENEALIDAVNQANTAKSAFLASMSHELRTPLNAIIGYSDLMKAGTLGPIQPARYQEYVDTISVSGAHLLKMINDILDLAKIEAGKRELNVVAVRLADVAKDAKRLVEPQAAQAHVEVMLDLKNDVVVRADERAVKQMLINLLSNAVKFSRPGGLAIVFCEVGADNRVSFGVKDTGTGMTAEVQRKALEPFTQANDKLTVEGHGTGLGLPIIKGLIEAHQGVLKIDSTPNVGSRIWVEFPAERLIRRAAAA